MRITNFLRYGPLALALLLTGCNREEEIAKWPEKGNYYDPAKPIAIESMTPDWGRINQSFVITGNFPLDLEKIKVYFADREAVLVNSDGRDLYGLVPKQNPGYNEVTMVVDGQTYSSDNITFKYYLTESVTTAVGKFGETTAVVGSLDEARINGVSDLVTVAGQSTDNLICSCGGWADKTYFVSFDDNMMTELTNIGYMGSVAVNNARDMIAVLSRGDGALYSATRADGWTFSPTGITYPYVSGGNNQGNMTFAEDDRYVYIMGTDGLWQVDLEGKVYTQMFSTTLFPDEFSGINTAQWRYYLTYSKYDKAFFCSYPENNGIFKYWQEADGTWKVERYAGFRASWEGGAVTGDRLNDALLKQPCGLCVNSLGELYVAVKDSHCIVKIKGREVSLVAGHPDASGTVNGTPTDTYFNAPMSIALDADENFYIGEENTGVVRKMTIE